jgi:hypothetical protein
MAIRAYTRKAKKKDCKRLAKVMRESDKKEVMASHGHSPLKALLNSYSSSEFCESIIYKGEVVGMCGVSKIDGLTGSPWLLGSDKLIDTPIIKWSFMVESKGWIKRVQKKHPMLVNYVHAGNKASLVWLKHLGFTFIRKVYFSKQPFYEFVRINNV